MGRYIFLCNSEEKSASREASLSDHHTVSIHQKYSNIQALDI